MLLSGRNRARLDALQQTITHSGGTAESAVLDATDAAAVRAYIAQADAAGRIDAAFNGIGLRATEGAYGTASASLAPAEFLRPLEVIAGSVFLTSALAGAAMAARGAGSVVTLSATLSGTAVPRMAGITAACGAIEAFTRSLAAEFGPSGVRVNCVRSTALPATRTIRETNARFHAELGLTGPAESPAENLLGRALTVADVAAATVFLFSAAAAGLTGQLVNVCGGTMLD